VRVAFPKCSLHCVITTRQGTFAGELLQSQNCRRTFTQPLGYNSTPTCTQDTGPARTFTDAVSTSLGTPGPPYHSLTQPFLSPVTGSTFPPFLTAGPLYEYAPEFIFGSRRSSLIGCFSALCLHVSQLRPGLYCIVLSSRLSCLRVVCINMNEYANTPPVSDHSTPGQK
jgi:hypothetical protein